MITDQVLYMLQNLSSWDFAIDFKNCSRGFIDLRQLRGVEALWVKAILNGSLQLGIRMHGERVIEKRSNDLQEDCCGILVLGPLIFMLSNKRVMRVGLPPTETRIVSERWLNLENKSLMQYRSAVMIMQEIGPNSVELKTAG
jgi:hypothetical protein